ncbi:hypothetical protein OS493_023431 [Desmophyllum pertusum]|uniref:Uncharacterized protein n=1 Tax=Desmophyllum pertusum TaxID=174260 RepID=A0A9W9ZM27_9CNID|nr:hypothetical protein OS493_023431 [Desmophyllum pertusum]
MNKFLHEDFGPQVMACEESRGRLDDSDDSVIYTFAFFLLDFSRIFHVHSSNMPTEEQRQRKREKDKEYQRERRRNRTEEQRQAERERQREIRRNSSEEQLDAERERQQEI